VTSSISKKGLNYTLLLSSGLLYASLAYFTTRENFTQVLLLYTVLFTFFIVLTKTADNFKFLSVAALLLRLVFITAIPNLSNDFYRFIWDGRMLVQGLNPYLHTPELFLQGNMAEFIHEGRLLYEGMGKLNGHHYTCYPPVNQLGFFIPAVFFSKNLLGSTVLMRLLIMAADVGVWWVGPKLLERLKLNKNNVFLYLLNPFIIIELTGNLHFEGVMIFFLVWSIYLLICGKWQWSAVIMALSIAVKLIPLIFLPLLIRKLRQKALLYYLITGGLTILMFAPFVSVALIDNFMSSINLYFQNFEFNASIYYIIRSIGYEVTGYNIIHKVGKILPLITLGLVLLISAFRKNERADILIISMIMTIGVYYLLSTTVHPWYVAVILSLSVFTKWRFALVWSFTVILSYSAYRSAEYHENLFLVGLEYTLVLIYLLYEFVYKKKSHTG
jgi:hypothetical protein